MLRERTLLLAKVEPAYGTDAVPSAASNAILCSLPDFSVVGRKLDRPNVYSQMGKLPPLNIGEGLNIKFSTELKNTGAVDAAPEIGVLFRGCNFTETITPSTGPVDYTPNSAFGITDSAESLSIHFYQDGILHKLLGARGTFNIELKAGEFGIINWDFTGLYAGPTFTSIINGTFDQTVPPRFLSASFTIDSYAAIIESLSIDMGNQIVMRKDANAATGIKEWLIANRAPSGNVDPEVVDLSTKNFWTMWSDSSPVALSATLGQTAAKKCVITAPRLVSDIPTYGDRDNILVHGLPFTLHPNAGNDEAKFSFQ